MTQTGTLSPFHAQSPAGGLTYLDNGATSFPKPPEVYEVMDSFYRAYGVNPGRSGFDLCIEAGTLLDTTRKQLTAFFGGT
ncbi:MAG: aminotransferase class V-fold PLP-dependent enzyme, partial [Holophaga sp.]|nr:aminotransferase class V-fold PLP-dependent enzyme [Holophaga sp.]